MILDTTSLIMIILIIITIIISFVSLSISISERIRKRRFLNSVYKNFVQRFIRKKKGWPDNCKDFYGLAVYEFLEEQYKKRTKSKNN